MAEPRRVRTQAERDADGTRWRALAAEHAHTYGAPCPVGGCRWPLDPGRGLSPVARVMAGLPEGHVISGDWSDFNAPDDSPAPLRRRWWHRYTRRTR